MGYYRGSGDYYRGRGSIFSAIGNVVKGAASFAAKTLFPIPAAILGAVHKGSPTPAEPATVAKNFPTIGSAIGSMIPSIGSAANPVGSSAHGTPAGRIPAVAPPGVGGGMGLARVPRPSGKGFYSQRHLHALAMGLSRARPRMNPFNPHALRRAERRAHSFLKHARKLMHFFTPKAPKGKAYIRARKRSR